MKKLTTIILSMVFLLAVVAGSNAQDKKGKEQGKEKGKTAQGAEKNEKGMKEKDEHAKDHKKEGEKGK